MKKTYYLITLFLFFHLTVCAKNDYSKDIDSLKQLYAKTDNDSIKIRSLNFIAHYYDEMNLVDSALLFIEKSKSTILSSRYTAFSTYPYIKSSQIYNRRAQYDQSLSSLLQLFDIAKKKKNPNLVGESLSLIIDLYDLIEDRNSAKYYVEQLVEVSDKMIIDKRKSDAYNTLGNYYKNINNNKNALDYHLKALKIRQDNKFMTEVAFSYNNIGLVYKNLGEFDVALSYMKKSLAIKDSLQNIKGMAGSNINIANVYLLKKDINQALTYVNKGIKLAKEAKALKFESNGYEILYKTLKQANKYKDAIEVMEQKLKVDSIIFNQETINKTNELEKKYKTEKKEQELLILQKESKIDKLQLKQKENELQIQKWIIALFIISFILIIYIIISLYRSKKRKQLINERLQEKNELITIQKEETEVQKKQLEIKNKEINETIDYAKGIQHSILPSIDKIKTHISDIFILHKPKSTLSTDFYWSVKINNTSFFAVADCSGSSISGALLSIVCSSILTKVVKTEKVTEPAEILSRTHHLLIVHFQKSKLVLESGMEISLIAIQRDENEKIKNIEFSGANSPLLIIDKQDSELKIIKGDKKSIGKSLGENKYTNHTIPVNNSLLLYMHTDGYPNQFGGNEKNNNGKKLKTNNFYKMLETYHKYSLKEQNQFLLEAFTKWKGQYEQADDICVVGIKL